MGMVFSKLTLSERLERAAEMCDSCFDRYPSEPVTVGGVELMYCRPCLAEWLGLNR